MSMRTCVTALLLVVGISFFVGAGPQESSEGPSAISKLHAKRVAALASVCNDARQNYENGEGSYIDILEAQLELNAGKLDAATTQKQKLELLQLGVNLRSDIEKRVQELHQIGHSSTADVNRALAARLKAEIDLLSAKVK